jgi:hypothetical protein
MTYLLLKTETNLLLKTDLNISFWNGATCMTRAGSQDSNVAARLVLLKDSLWLTKILVIAIIAPIIICYIIKVIPDSQW